MAVRGGNLSFVPGASGISGCKQGKWKRDHSHDQLFIYASSGGTVNRNFLILGTAALAVAGAVFAQDPPAAKSQTKKSANGNAAAVERGKEMFDKKCAICHYADNDQKKIGPGLKGVKEGKLPSGKDTSHAAILKQIEDGGGGMPVFRELLSKEQKDDIAAFVMTL